jgi:CTP:molybdopterin cytidylyltransferase MocA
MGRPKALLEDAEGVTFVERLVSEALSGGASRVVVVGRPDDEPVRGTAERAGATFTSNPAPARGQLSSLVCGLDVLTDDEVDSIVVLPVDVPGVTSAVIAVIIRAAGGSPAPIVRAVHRGAHGHPVLFKRVLFEELRCADQTIGARAVVRADPARVLDVEVDDPRILHDVDTPDDYSRLLAGDRSDQRGRVRP